MADPLTLQNAVCLHEEDYGMLWKHVDWRTNYTEVRRSRRLVVSFIATVGNYEYGFYWYFYQDGSLQFEVKLTGIISNGAVRAGRRAAVGRAGRAAGVRADSPALFQRASRHDGGWTEQLGLRSQHRGGSARPGATRTATRSTPSARCWLASRGATRDRPAVRALLDDRQSVVAQSPGPTGRLQADAGRERRYRSRTDVERHAARRRS